MRKLYCGGSFRFDYLKKEYREEAAKDFRAVLLGNADRLLTRGNSIVLHADTEYIGPYYFETDGMQDRDIVQTEWEMVRGCTDAIFLLDEANCPGTVCELTAASLLGKRVYIFYLQKNEDQETESNLHTPCWYPIIHSLSVNKNTKIFPCGSYEDAVHQICTLVDGFSKNV